MIRLETAVLPDFGKTASFPAIPRQVYQDRLERVVDRMERDRLDFMVVYGDREHSANLAYLTGFDPRFEEALLLLDRAGNRALLVGNECMGYLPDPSLRCESVLFQDFSLLGQTRSSSPPLRKVFADFRIGPGAAVGCVGWKYFDGSLVEDPDHAMDLPGYVVDLLRDMVGGRDGVRNATAIFMRPSDGLRMSNEVEQIAQFEYAAARTSDGVLSVLRHLSEGVRERDLEVYLDSAGLPLSCHRMINFGAKAARGLSSPGDGTARRGDPYQVAFGVTGALTCRSGVIAGGPKDLPEEVRGFYPRFIENYFDVVANWYRSVNVGATGGEVFAAVEVRRDPSLFSFALNPGHTLHLDEWVNSPFSKGDETVLRSGMAIQIDIIPVSAGPFCTANAEDGIVLADETLRSRIAQRFPECWGRIQARRKFMMEGLGLALDETVLPLGNTSGWLAPYAFSLDKVLVQRTG